MMAQFDDKLFAVIREDLRDLREEQREGFADQRVYINGKFEKIETRVRVLEDLRQRGSLFRAGGGRLVYFVLELAVAAVFGMLLARGG